MNKIVSLSVLFNKKGSNNPFKKMNWQLNKENKEASLEKKSDAQIVELTLKDQEYFLYIIKRYKTRLYLYIRRISSLDEEEAEDVLQEVFMKVYQNLNDYDKNLKFSSWIYRITHNQVISNFRKVQARPQKAVFDLEDDVISNIASELDLSREIDKKILRKKVTKVLDRLNPKIREILVLKFLEERSYTEISDIIKKPVGTVGSMLNRAKKEFKKELEKAEIKI